MNTLKHFDYTIATSVRDTLLLIEIRLVFSANIYINTKN